MKKSVLVLVALCAVSARAQLIPYTGGGFGNGAPCAEAVVAPQQIAASSIGILFADATAQQARWCGAQTVRRIGQFASTAIGIVRDDSTAITYVTTADGALTALDPNGVQTVMNVVGLQKPTQLTLGGGSLWIADRAANAVWRATLPCAGSCVPEKVMDASVVTGPQGITWSLGNLYVSDTFGGRVLKRAAGSGAISVVTSAINPLGLAVDSAGALYIAEPTRVRRITASGVSSTFATVNSAVGLTVKTTALPGQVSAHEYLFIGSLTDGKIYAVDVAAVGPTATATATETLAPTRTSTATSVPTATASATKLPTCRSTPTPQTDCS